LGWDQSVLNLSAAPSCDLMAQEPFPSWFAMMIGFVPGATTAAIAWFRFRTERSDKHTETVSELRDRVRTNMDVQSLAMYDRLEAENKRLVARLRDIERDRDRGWDLARWWNSEAHRVKHLLANALHLANLRLEQGLLTTVHVPEIRMPSIEEPVLPHGEEKPSGQ
jgi:hypothetical protein